MRTSLYLFAGLALLFASLPTHTLAQKPTVRLNKLTKPLNCDDAGSGLCTDRASHKNYEGKYVGHDEPSLLFYSNRPGSGNSSVYELTLPKDPPTSPRQDGSGGTFNFQLHSAFWVGMAICDTQSFPLFTDTCNADTDANIADNADPNAPDFIGNHVGTAFMEMQFYPPGWVDSPQLIDPQNYFAAMTIFSLSINGATGANNNAACLNAVGQEPGNFAVITKNGVPLFPANPLGANFGQNNPDLNNVLSMAPGDKLLIILHDTPAGFEVIIEDLTSGHVGRMVASHTNGFGQVVFDPNATSCNVTPYDFHPMYSTSSEHTNVPWAVHSYNVAFSDELGHFEFCDNADQNFPFGCTVPGVNDISTGLDADDFFCFGPFDANFPGAPFQSIGGCTSTEFDFDGVSYGFNWPGTNPNPKQDKQLHAQPIRFSSPLFIGEDGLHNYSRAAFESDLAALIATCDPVTGNGCILTNTGAAFYPIYSTMDGNHNDDEGEDAEGEHTCRWQLGGNLIPGTTNSFGGNASTEYGPPVATLFQTGPSTAQLLFSNFRQILGHNPCRQEVTDQLGGQVEHFVQLHE